MTEKRKRRWFQFSLRALLVFVLLASIGMSWLGVKMERARRQREAVEAILSAPCHVRYEPFSERTVPEWASALFGDHFFVYVVEVRALGAGFGDNEAKYLKQLTNLTELDLWRSQVTDAGLVHLKGLTNLERLNLCDTQVTPQGIDSLRLALPNCAIMRRPTPAAAPKTASNTIPASPAKPDQ